MKYRKLRIAWSVVCGVACVLLIALWVRNYRNRDSYPNPLLKTGNFAIYSNNGVLMAMQSFWFENASTESVGYFMPNTWQADVGGYGPNRPHEGLSGFYIAIHSRASWMVQIPHWFPVVLAGMASMTCAATWFRWRFSLRTLSIATTLVAIVLGLIMWAVR